MKKNNIFIVIDSIFYDRTITKPDHISPMPFLEKLRKEGLDFTNMYSEAPYTEAALVSLLCGNDTLKYGGYLKKLYGHKTMMEVFEENGYDTFCNCIQPQVYPSYAYPGVNDAYYNVCYEFDTFWSYRLEFYSNKYRNNELDNDTLNVITLLLEDNLKTWKEFFISLKENKKITSFIYKYVDIRDLNENIKLLDIEINKFNKDKDKYTKHLLDVGKEHELFKIHTYNLSKKMTKENMIKLYDNYKDIIKKMRKKTFIYNIKNNKLSFPKYEDKKGQIKAYINAVYNRFLFDKIDYNIESKKAAPSMDTTIKYFENWLENRDSTNPYFAYIHVDDCHSKEIFYTYDTDDFSKLDEEFNMINNYMDNLPKNYRGSISYDVSLGYADLCLKRLFTYLEENKMLDNVNVFICADHGSSYTYAPFRCNYVNNVHRENYNMPFIIWSKNIKHKKYNGLYNTKDIPATIIDMNNIKIPKIYDGISVLKNDGRDYVMLENVPGGCPDYNLRDFWLGIRNKKYLVVMILNYKKEFKDGIIKDVYDLKNDPSEVHNLKETISMKDIKNELNILEEEFNKLKKNMVKYNFLNKE